jgi:hypothetical protein
MRNVVLLLAILGSALAFPRRAAAWHQAGHMTIARIAYHELDDGQKARIARILKAHPHYARYLTQERPEGVPEHEWAFLRASVWPDWVRPQRADPRPDADEIVRKYHRGAWHYINLRFIPPGQDVAIPPNTPAPDYDARGEPGHVLTALKKCMTILWAEDMPDEAKAVYLCWLLHLVGDIHQPLHCTTLISEQFPRGDLGGNLFLVSLKEGGPAVNLHFYWDALLFREQAPFKDIQAKADELRRAPDLQRARLPELKATEFKAWAEEGLVKAREVAYQNGRLKGGKGQLGESVKTAVAPVLPEGYAQAAASVARRRITLAGYRLADQLGAVFKAR